MPQSGIVLQRRVSDGMLAIVWHMLPHATVNALQLNRNVACGKHKDAMNSVDPVLRSLQWEGLSV